jgi:hypothetical protein
MLENMFLGYRTDHDMMLNQFAIKRIAHFMGWPPVRAHMRRFKMADDLQRSAFFFQLNQAGKISTQTLLQEVDFEPAQEEMRRKIELDKELEFNRKMQTAQASITGEMSLVQARYSRQLQDMMMPDGQTPGMPPGAAPDGQEGADGPDALPGMPGSEGQQTGSEGEMMDGKQADPAMPAGSTISRENAQNVPTEGIPTEMQSPMTANMKGGGYNVLYLARRAATHLLKMEEGPRMAEMNNMKMTNPQLYSLVLQLVNKESGGQDSPLDPTKPQPFQKPSRRTAKTGV